MQRQKRAPSWLLGSLFCLGLGLGACQTIAGI